MSLESVNPNHVPQTGICFSVLSIPKLMPEAPTLPGRRFLLACCSGICDGAMQHLKAPSQHMPEAPTKRERRVMPACRLQCIADQNKCQNLVYISMCYSIPHARSTYLARSSCCSGICFLELQSLKQYVFCMYFA